MQRLPNTPASYDSEDERQDKHVKNGDNSKKIWKDYECKESEKVALDSIEAYTNGNYIDTKTGLKVKTVRILLRLSR